MAQAKFELAPRNGLLHGVRLAVKLGTNCGPNEVSAIREETLSNQQVDMA
jgi:hypothetical protein